jgi:exosortase/archaeosortase family protein
MPDTLDFSGLASAWIIAIIIVAALFGGGGYFIASRRVKQSAATFFARFTVVFLVLLVIESVVLTWGPSLHETMGEITATLVGGLMETAGAGASVIGTTIAVQGPFIVFDVTPACLGGLLLWAYVALVLAESRATGRQRAAGIVFGIAILLGFNFFRITSSVYLQWLTEVRIHDYFYMVNMLVVLLVWAGWLRTLKHRRPGVAGATPGPGRQPRPRSA